MKLYTERHGRRSPQEKTYSVNRDMYSLLFDCCIRYKKNLTHIFMLDSHDDFTKRDFVEFNENVFMTRVKIRIPSLFRNGDDKICVPRYNDEYNQYALLDLIEFFAQNIKDISEQWNNMQYRNYQYIDCLNTFDIFEDFQKEINELFTETGLLYKLTDEKTIERIIENSPLTIEIENSFSIVDEEGTRELLKDAVALYKTPNPAARQDSVEKIWDALERLKTYYTTLDKRRSSEKVVNDIVGSNSDFFDLFNDEFKMLTSIGNKYRIRHHETDKIDITESV